MHTIIIAQNLLQAAFIKKGLYYENLSCDVVPFNVENVPNDEIMVADGAFILLERFEDIETAANFCRNIKHDMPIIALVQKYEIVHERLLTESKINFLFSRPFPFRQMSAEMRYAIFHQKEKMEFGKYILRDLELDLARHQVKLSDQSLYLRNKEFSLLHYLMVNKGKVLSRSDILENVWDRNANILTNTVDVHISQLRKKMGEGKNQKYIHTIPCTGYIFE